MKKSHAPVPPTQMDGVGMQTENDSEPSCFYGILYFLNNENKWHPVLKDYVKIELIDNGGKMRSPYKLVAHQANDQLLLDCKLGRSTRTSKKDTFVKWNDEKSTHGARFSKLSVAQEFSDKITALLNDLSPCAEITKKTVQEEFAVEASNPLVKSFLDLANIGYYEVKKPAVCAIVKEFIFRKGGERYLQEIRYMKPSQRVIDDINEMSQQITAVAESPSSVVENAYHRAISATNSANLYQNTVQYDLRRARSVDTLSPRKSVVPQLERSSLFRKKRPAPLPPAMLKDCFAESENCLDFKKENNQTPTDKNAETQDRQSSVKKRQAPRPPEEIPPVCKTVSATNITLSPAGCCNLPLDPLHSSLGSSVDVNYSKLQNATKERSLSENVLQRESLYKPAPTFYAPPPPSEPPPTESITPVLGPLSAESAMDEHKFCFSADGMSNVDAEVCDAKSFEQWNTEVSLTSRKAQGTDRIGAGIQNGPEIIARPESLKSVISSQEIVEKHLLKSTKINHQEATIGLQELKGHLCDPKEEITKPEQAEINVVKENLSCKENTDRSVEVGTSEISAGFTLELLQKQMSSIAESILLIQQNSETEKNNALLKPLLLQQTILHKMIEKESLLQDNTATENDNEESDSEEIGVGTLDMKQGMSVVEEQDKEPDHLMDGQLTNYDYQQKDCKIPKQQKSLTKVDKGVLNNGLGEIPLESNDSSITNIQHIGCNSKNIVEIDKEGNEIVVLKKIPLEQVAIPEKMASQMVSAKERTLLIKKERKQADFNRHRKSPVEEGTVEYIIDQTNQIKNVGQEQATINNFTKLRLTTGQGDADQMLDDVTYDICDAKEVSTRLIEEGEIPKTSNNEQSEAGQNILLKPDKQGQPKNILEGDTKNEVKESERSKKCDYMSACVPLYSNSSSSSAEFFSKNVSPTSQVSNNENPKPPLLGLYAKIQQLANSRITDYSQVFTLGEKEMHSDTSPVRHSLLQSLNRRGQVLTNCVNIAEVEGDSQALLNKSVKDKEEEPHFRDAKGFKSRKPEVEINTVPLQSFLTSLVDLHHNDKIAIQYEDTEKSTTESKKDSDAVRHQDKTGDELVAMEQDMLIDHSQSTEVNGNHMKKKPFNKTALCTNRFAHDEENEFVPKCTINHFAEKSKKSLPKVVPETFSKQKTKFNSGSMNSKTQNVLISELHVVPKDQETKTSNTLENKSEEIKLCAMSSEHKSIKESKEINQVAGIPTEIEQCLLSSASAGLPVKQSSIGESIPTMEVKLCNSSLKQQADKNVNADASMLGEYSSMQEVNILDNCNRQTIAMKQVRGLKIGFATDRPKLYYNK